MTLTIRRLSTLASTMFVSCGLLSACAGAGSPSGPSSTSGGLTVTPTTIAFTQVGATAVLEVPSTNHCPGGVTFVSTNLDVATVSNEGINALVLAEAVITAEGPGSATIKVVCLPVGAANSEVDVPVTVTITNATLGSVVLNPSFLQFSVIGQTLTTKATQAGNPTNSFTTSPITCPGGGSGTISQDPAGTFTIKAVTPSNGNCSATITGLGGFSATLGINF